jgi:hypothetical protein
VVVNQGDRDLHIRYHHQNYGMTVTVPLTDLQAAQIEELANQLDLGGFDFGTIREMEDRMAIEVRRRTAEEEALYIQLAREAQTRIFGQVELETYHRLQRLAPFLAATPMAVDPARGIDPVMVTNVNIPVAVPVPVPPKDRVYVKVAKGDDSYGRDSWVISVRINKEEKDLPEALVVRGFLPEKDKHFISARQRRYRSSYNVLQDALRAGLSPQTLHDALKAWVMAAFFSFSAESTTPIDDETSYLLKAQPATLEVGGKVFKLVPCGEVDVRPLITRVRTKALAGAKAESAVILTKAKTDARLVVSSAEVSAQSIKAEVELLRREASSMLPTWVRDSSRAAYWSGGRWWVQLNVNCRIKEIRLTVSEWRMVFYWNPLTWPVGLSTRDRVEDYYVYHPMHLFVRLNPEGKYTLDDVRHAATSQESTVHTSRERTCMALQLLPPALNTRSDLIALEKGISRGMQVVNLNSPLSRDYHNFYPDFKAQIPPIVAKWLTGHLNIYPMRTGQSLAAFQEANPSITWDRTESLEQEGAGVFNTDQYQPTPVIQPAVTIQQAIDEHAALNAIAEEITGGNRATRR